jgi:hypothetical protein
MIAFGKTVHFSVPMLIEAAADAIRNPNIQRGVVFIGKNVHPIIVIAHLSRNNQ